MGGKAGAGTRRWLAGAAVLSIAPLIAMADQPVVAPLGCGITWTRTGGVWTYLPDCTHQSPPQDPPPQDPPPVPDAPPPTP